MAWEHYRTLESVSVDSGPHVTDSAGGACYMADFLLWRVSDATLQSRIGVDRFGETGLLRLLAGNPWAQAKGLSTGLLHALQATAAASGVCRLFLSTTTATPFFQAHGYALCERTKAPEPIQRGIEFTSICPASAACLSIQLQATRTP